MSKRVSINCPGSSASVPGSSTGDRPNDSGLGDNMSRVGAQQRTSAGGRLRTISGSELGHQLDNLEEEDEEDEDNPVEAIGRPAVARSRDLVTGSGMRAGHGSVHAVHVVEDDEGNDNDSEDEDGHTGLLQDGDVIEYLDDEFSVGLPSDIPSGIIDIEGNILVDLQIGQELDEDEIGVDSSQNRFSTRRNPATGARPPGGLNSRTLSHPSQEDDQFDVNDPRFASEGRAEPVRRLSVISNGKVFMHGRGYHLHNHPNDARIRGIMARDNSTSAQSNVSSSTIQQHYYPEGGWGWVVLFSAVFSHVLMCGFSLCAGLMISAIVARFGEGEEEQVRKDAGWLGACSVGISLLLSPIWVSICKRKSTRLTAVFGGLVAALGCLFTSFATQLHQVFFSYATILGVGVGLTRDASSLMVGQYFRKKRDFVEMIVVAASGFGILLMSLLINNAISYLGWRLGLQAVTGCLFFCFFLGTCYRSASLYHPQRRAILHLKNQKRKIKEKEKRNDGPPFLDFTCLKSKTVQILLLSSAFVAFGIYTPLFYLANDYLDNSQDFDHLTMSLMYVYLGGAWVAGCVIFGILVVQQSKECRVSKQYLCQMAGIISGISIATYPIVQGQSGLIIFCSIYGFSLGGYHYALKSYTFERVRTRHFPRAWSFIQSSQAMPLFFGVPITGYLNHYFPGYRAGYYLSATGVFLGSLFLFLSDVRKRRMSRRKSANSSTKTCETLHTLSASRTTSTALSISLDKNSASSSKFNRASGQKSSGGSDNPAGQSSSDTSGFHSADAANTDKA